MRRKLVRFLSEAISAPVFDARTATPVGSSADAGLARRDGASMRTDLLNDIGKEAVFADVVNRIERV